VLHHRREGTQLRQPRPTIHGFISLIHAGLIV
jgi:hypothetical protein